MQKVNGTQKVLKEIKALKEQVLAMREEIKSQKIQVTEHPHIFTSEKMHGGEPTIRGTAITVRTIVGCTRIGETIDEILEAYQFLTRAQVYDALAYYYDHTAEIDRYIRENEEASWRLLQRASTSHSTPTQT